MVVNSHTNLQFSALYYPYSRLLYQTDLKRAALVFDKILFVDPLSRDITEHPGQYPLRNPQIEIRSGLENPESGFPVSHLFRRRHFGAEARHHRIPEWYDVVETYETLKRHGLTQLIVPQEHLQPSQGILAFSILRDICQNVFHQMGVWDLADWWDEDRRHSFGWRVHTSRIPESLVNLRTEKDVLVKCIKQASDKKLDRKELKVRLMRVSQVLSIIAESFQESQHDEVVLPFGIAYLLILNQALLLCEEQQAFPVTDDPYAHEGLMTKIANVYSSTEKPVRNVLPQPTASDLYRIQSFTLGVISRLIPDEALDRLDMDQIVAFREHNAKALQRFRVKMVEMVSAITTNPWESDFQSQVLRTIEGEIIPEIQVLDDELRDSYHKLFGSAVSKFGSALTKAIAPSLPTMTIATLLGLPTGQIVLLGAASLMSGLGIMLPDLVEYWRDRRMSKRNGLAFLLKFRSHFD